MNDIWLRERMDRRAFLGAAATVGGATMLGAVLAACGAPGGASGTASIDTWDWWVSQSPWLDHELKQFEHANGSIQVRRTVNATSSYVAVHARAAEQQRA